MSVLSKVSIACQITSSMALSVFSTPPNKATRLKMVWERMLPRDAPRSLRVLQADLLSSHASSLERSFIKDLQKGKKFVYVWKHNIPSATVKCANSKNITSKHPLDIAIATKYTAFIKTCQKVNETINPAREKLQHET